MKKNLCSFYIILTVIGLTIIFLFPVGGRAECDQRAPFGECAGDSNIIMQPQETAVENAALPGQATLISPWGQTFDTTPTYTWTAVTNATWYHLWINRGSSTFGEKWYTAAEVGCPAGTGNCSLTVPADLPAGTYTWWIQAWYNAYGPWSDGKVFYVDPNGKNCQNISSVGFTAYSSNMTYDVLNGWRYRTGGADYWFDGAVHLPAGAQITQVFLDYYDSNATYDVSFWLFGRVPGSDSAVFSYGAGSSGTPGHARLEVNLIPYNIIVDNAGHTYQLRVYLPATDSTNRFLDAIICYKPIP